MSLRHYSKVRDASVGSGTPRDMIEEVGMTGAGVQAKIKMLKNRTEASCLFPFNSRRRFGADVIHNSVDTFDFIDYLA